MLTKRTHWTNGQFGENMNIDVLRQPFIKSNALMNLDEAWVTSGKEEAGDIAQLYREVSYLFRGVNILSNAVARMPFQVENDRGDIVDESVKYKNVVGFMPHPGYLFGILEAALQIWGYAYLLRVMRGRYIDKLRYILPTTIRYKIDEDTGEIAFTRIVNGKKLPVSDQIVYFWNSDPYVELGTPTTSSVQAAASAGDVLLNVDKFAAAFFERGAIKATLLTTKGNVIESERSKLRQWWDNLTGSKQAWGAHIVNADAVDVQQIGEGLESLDNRNLTDEQRESIATALGIPHSILFSNAANFAVSDKDDFHFYDKKVVPDCEFIQEVSNEQIFHPNGYHLNFLPETLDIFQEDEKERAASLQFLTQTLEKGPIAGVAMDILGYEVQDETRAALEKIWADEQFMEEQRRQDFIDRLNQSQQQDNTERPRVPKESDIDKSERDIDLEKWQRYAQKRVKNGKVPDREFVSDHIDGATKGAIYEALKFCETPEEVDAVFGDVWVGYP